ncbi:MAG TPA: hypothetical protein VG963_02015 [Polyangiaceae bacterium]|nr:hypothetical protein [Polyangiaceae bacterium]
MTKSIHARGDNYCIELDGGVARCRVWSRPDLDFETGARLAAEKVSVIRTLAAGLATSMLFDLRDAPKVTGPKTQHALAQILRCWEVAAKPIAVLVSPASMQKLQLTRIASDVAPVHAAIFVELEEAEVWLVTRVTEPRPPLPAISPRISLSGPAPINSLAPSGPRNTLPIQILPSRRRG